MQPAEAAAGGTPNQGDRRRRRRAQPGQACHRRRRCVRRPFNQRREQEVRGLLVPRPHDANRDAGRQQARVRPVAAGGSHSASGDQLTFGECQWGCAADFGDLPALADKEPARRRELAQLEVQLLGQVIPAEQRLPSPASPTRTPGRGRSGRRKARRIGAVPGQGVGIGSGRRRAFAPLVRNYGKQRLDAAWTKNPLVPLVLDPFAPPGEHAESVLQSRAVGRRRGGI